MIPSGKKKHNRCSCHYSVLLLILTLGLPRCECMFSFTSRGNNILHYMRNRTRLLFKYRINFRAVHSAILKPRRLLLRTMTCLSFTPHIHWGHVSLRSLYLLSQIIILNFIMNEINSSFHWFFCRGRQLSLLDALIGQRSNFHMAKQQCFHFWVKKRTVIGNH